MPPKAKSKNTPNQHDKRHENGLAPPGKRVTRQRSNGQLNGQPNGKSTPSVTPPALPSTGLNSGFKFPLPADSTPTIAARAPGPPINTARDRAATLEGSGRDRTSSDASVEDGGPFGEVVDNLYEHPSLRTGADNASPGCQHKPDHAASPFTTVSTILACYPLRDAISILILLLSLPHTIVLVIQTLFASLTFVPPTVGLSLSTLPNLKEIFNSSNVGYPALATLLFVDLIFWVFWLPLWKPIQDVLLDMSQAVIAISLSGAAASNTRPTYSIATCAVAVCTVHVLRYRAIHLTALDYLRSVIHKLDITVQIDVPLFATFSYSPPPVERGWPFTVFRTMLGIHIFAQGITTCIRRTLVKANEKELVLAPKAEAEATAGPEQALRSSAATTDTLQPPQTASSTDGRPPGPSPAHRDKQSRDSNSKKKRKQANQVRSQQPLWAAIASTKVTFIKEMEQRDAADDAREAAVMDNNTTTTFTSTNITADRIWVCEIRDTEIHFCVELTPGSLSIAATGDKEYEISLTAGIDRSKPFFVRINGATWSSTRIKFVPELEESDHRASGRFVGDIFGLAPLSSYHCEVVCIAKQRVLCSASLITQSTPSAEQTALAPAPSQHQSLRPSSPRTTLKQSIQSAEAKLNETRNRMKKAKKDQRAAQSHIRNEINRFRSLLETSGGTDEKLERRLLQITQHKNQAEEAVAEIKTQIEALDDIPRDEVEVSDVRKRAWTVALNAKTAASQALENVKAESDRELNALKSEISSAEAKKEKLSARITQRVQELEKLVVKQQADLTAKQRRDLDRAQVLQQREAKENEIRYVTNSMEAGAQSFAQKAQETWQEVSSLNQWSTQAPSGYTGLTSPPTPEGTIASSNGAVSTHSNGFANGAFGPQPFQLAFHTTQGSVNPAYANANVLPRGRSSSMLSQYSGFTDNGEDFVFAPGEPQQQYSWPVQGPMNGEDYRPSDGEGSETVSGDASLNNGSTNGSNSPRPEAKPFVPSAAVNPLGTIGPPSRKSPQSPHANSPSAIGGGR